MFDSSQDCHIAYTPHVTLAGRISFDGSDAELQALLQTL